MTATSIGRLRAPAGSLRRSTTPTGLSRRQLLQIAGWYAVTRLVTVVAAAIADSRPGRGFPLALLHYDAGWYLRVAQFGYGRRYQLPDVTGLHAQSRTAFLPGYPLVEALTHRLLPVIGWDWTAVATSTVSGLAAALVVAGLVARWQSPDVAVKAAIAMSAYLGSSVFTGGYAEPMFIALAAGSLLAVTHDRWVTAGLLAAAAAATRPNGLYLAAALAVMALLAIHERRAWRALAAPLLATLGFAVFLVHLQLHTGRWDGWFYVENRGWGNRGPELPQLLVSSVVHQPLRPDLWTGAAQVQAVGWLTVIGCLLGAVLLRVRLPVLAIVYTGAMLAPLAVTHVGMHPRFVMVAVPLFIVPARLIGWPWRIYLLVSMVLLGLVTIWFLEPAGAIP